MQLVTAGGRVLSVVAHGTTLQAAVERVYAAAISLSRACIIAKISRIAA